MMRIVRPTNSYVPFRPEDIHSSIPARFAEQVRRAPDQLAVSGEDKSLSYSELDRLSNRVARRIVGAVGSAKEPVVLMLEQGIAPVAAILGVLKAGRPYVPLDLDLPDRDLQTMAADSGAGLVLAEGDAVGRARSIASSGMAVVDIADFLDAGEEAAMQPTADPGSPAYIFYTSGTTGRPKGVVDCHRNVLHNVLRYTNTLHIVAGDRLTLIQPPSFSGTVSSLFGALMNGATICPFDLRRSTPSALAAWLNAEEVSIYHSVPALFRGFLTGDRFFPSVRLVRLEGDRASRLDWELFCRHFTSDCLLVNGLGITETGLVRQYFLDRQSSVPPGHLPVGYPIDDMDCLVVDHDGRPLEPDQPGEIAVRSRFLALGYWGSPDATDAAFHPDPADDSVRVFRTRDRGLLRPDGCLEYLGRSDLRIRIRGQWVDPERVEAALAALPSIADAVVVGRQDHRGELSVVGYVVPASGAPPAPAEIRRALRDRLPAVMVPSHFVLLDSLPLNAHQKVDRRIEVLPEPEWQAHDVAVPPWTLLEQQLAELWKEMLGVEGVGLDDDFFDLGGHSLLAVQMLDRVEDMFGRKIPPAALLAGATIERLSQILLSESTSRDRPIECLNAGDGGPGFFFLHGDLQSGGVYTRNLARFLDPGRPFYVLAPADLADAGVPPSFEAMAARQVSALRQVQPHGPYLLGGLCNGGHVAYEMARLLAAEGESVPLVMMIRATAQGVRHRTAHRVIGWMGRAFGSSAAWRQSRFLQWREFVDEFERRSPWDRIAFVAGKVPRLIRRLLHTRGAGQPGTGQEDDAMARGTAYLKLERAYLPSPYPGQITLLWPEEDEERAEEAAGRWKAAVEDVELHVVRGTHLTCVTRYSKDLAERLEACLRRATQ